MRAFVVPLAAVGLLAGVYSDQPGEQDMQGAFAATLAAEVQSALDFAAETGGPGAVERIRQAGTDRFEIRSFRKLDCARDEAGEGHVCDFAVDIDVVNGSLQRQLTGRFFAGPDGLKFAHDV
jgi:hypothetical protein